MSELLVSVIIPSYNSAHYLADSVESVLAQAYQNIELIVVDDGSTDNTKEVLKKYGDKVQYIYQKNSGVSAARNNGIRQCNGNLIAFLDADDLFVPSKLEKQVAALKNRPNAKFCYSAVMWVDDNLNEIGVRQSYRQNSALEDLLFYGNIMGNPAIICESDLIKSLGGFDEKLSQCADWDMWIRLAMETDFLYLEEPLVRYRQHGSSMSRNPKLLENDSLAVINKAFSQPHLAKNLKSDEAKARAKVYMVVAGTYFQAGYYKDFLRCAWKAISLDAKQSKYLLDFPRRFVKNRFAN